MNTTKKLKLNWIRNTRTYVHARVLKNYPSFTCLAFLKTSGGQALSWYVSATNFAMGAGIKAYRELYSGDFDGEGLYGRNPNRLMWLAMLETLVKEGVIE